MLTDSLSCFARPLVPPIMTGAPSLPIPASLFLRGRSLSLQKVNIALSRVSALPSSICQDTHDKNNTLDNKYNIADT